MRPVEFETLLCERMELWNNRMPDCKIAMAFYDPDPEYRYKCVVHDLRCGYINRAIGVLYFADYALINAEDVEETYMLLDELIDMLEDYFRIEENKSDTWTSNNRITVPRYLVHNKLAIKADKITTGRYTYGESGGDWGIKKVIFSGPCTIVLWKNGTKTIVRCMEGETFDKEKGLAMAIIKHYSGSEGSTYQKVFKKWCKDES